MVANVLTNQEDTAVFVRLIRIDFKKNFVIVNIFSPKKVLPAIQETAVNSATRAYPTRATTADNVNRPVSQADSDAHVHQAF